MLYTIRNEFLEVTASRAGAQLQSIRGADGTQYLWQGDPAYWGDRALNLFPYVARLWEGSYLLDGERFHMPIHGFASQSCFEVTEESDTEMVFRLRESEATLVQYPRRFELRIVYALRGNTLFVTFEVKNRDGRMMFFGVGGHPGFNVPLEDGGRFEEYRLRFGQGGSPVRVGFSADCFANGQDEPFPLEEGRILPLRHDLFDDDAIVLRDMAREVTLETEGGAHSVTVAYPDMPYLGIWHMPRTDAPYVCIEPWSSLPSRHGQITVMEEKEDLIRLLPGDTFSNTWSMTIR